MRYWKAPNDEVFGYDETDEAQLALMNDQTMIDSAVIDGWSDVTASWPPVLAPAPNLTDFMTGLKSAMGGIVALNTLMTAYPLLNDSLGSGAWSDAQALLVDAKANGKVSADQAAAIDAAAVSSHIPITLG